MRLEERAFTFIEFVIVIAVVAILAVAIFVAVDPVRRLHVSRNEVREVDVTNILEFVKGEQGLVPVEMVVGQYYVIGTAEEGCDTTCSLRETGSACMSLDGVSMDPLTGTAKNTDYYIMLGAGGEITVGACDSEGEEAGGSGVGPIIEVVGQNDSSVL